MTSDPFVSIIVPAHNARQQLGPCIAAINDSTYKAFELIVVDDASTDGSGELAYAHGARVLSRRRQGGPAAARNRGAQAARGDLLLFVDADVLLRPDTLSRVVAQTNGRGSGFQQLFQFCYPPRYLPPGVIG